MHTTSPRRAGGALLRVDRHLAYYIYIINILFYIILYICLTRPRLAGGAGGGALLRVDGPGDAVRAAAGRTIIYIYIYTYIYIYIYIYIYNVSVDGPGRGSRCCRQTASPPALRAEPAGAPKAEKPPAAKPPPCAMKDAELEARLDCVPLAWHCIRYQHRKEQTPVTEP